MKIEKGTEDFMLMQDLWALWQHFIEIYYRDVRLDEEWNKKMSHMLNEFVNKYKKKRHIVCNIDDAISTEVLRIENLMSYKKKGDK